MKKSILNLGKALNKAEQKTINGGTSWAGVCFPSEGKCNYYCSADCTPCGSVGYGGYTPHICNETDYR